MPSTAHILVHDPEVVIEITDHFRETYCRSDHFHLQKESHVLYNYEPEDAMSTGNLSIGCTYISRHWQVYPDLFTSNSSSADSEYYVTSNALMTASPILHDMLSGPVKKSGSDAKIRVVAQGVNSLALAKILHVIYHRTSRVPCRVSIGQLAYIAVIFEALECCEAVRPYIKLWCESVQDLGSLQQFASVSVDLLLWVWITFVFHRADEFKQATHQILQLADSGPLATVVGLPIEKILAIQRKLLEVMNKLVTNLFDWCSHDASNSYECGCMLYGVLYIKMTELGTAKDTTGIRYPASLSIRELCDAVHNIEDPLWRSSPAFSIHPCSLKELRSSFSYHSLAVELEDARN